ncbi:hypothetical protein EDD86DRAFT_1248 [Gorgonomyces haynaldii]|nr:hypothetical protein EDD86DRAFT_1248 [Gorgonomyces haynaldii]
MAVVCLGNMVISSGSKHQPLHRRVFDLLQRVLTTEQHPIVLTSALKSMELLTNESKTMAQECTNLLSKLHQIIFTNKKPTIETRIKHPFGSDSELSDMEGPYRQHKREWQLTQNALLLLQSLVKQSPKTMYPHLGRFVHPTEPSLVQIVKGHPNEKVRIAATDVLIYFFDDSKKYMQLAAGPKKKGSFTSLSEKVAEQISVIVEACVRLIKSEIRPNVISRLFDLLNVMLLNCPFTELGSDPLPIIYDVLVDKIQDSGSCFHVRCNCGPKETRSLVSAAGLWFWTASGENQPTDALGLGQSSVIDADCWLSLAHCTFEKQGTSELATVGRAHEKTFGSKRYTCEDKLSHCSGAVCT